MTDSLIILLVTTGSIGFFHTIMGPDHYLPFIVMSRSGKWSYRKTIVVTVLCGFGHVLSSVTLAIIIIVLGMTVLNLDLIESVRSSVAGWALITFGMLYMIWGIKQSQKYKAHEHSHQHVDGKPHKHKHVHTGNHSHLHNRSGKNEITPWILFLIFVFGPCEPLIPLLMYPALNNHIIGFILVATIFAVVTLATMLGIVLISYYGINQLFYDRYERYTPALAGFTILLCGFSIQFLGL